MTKKELPAVLQHRRWLVSGRVQGVGFRAATCAELARCKLEGSASNLADGRVEVTAAGAPEKLDRLADWLARGPRYAIVESVEECEQQSREESTCPRQD